MPHREPVLTTPLPSYPWKHVAADLLELEGSTYLLVAYCYSRLVEVQKLTTTNSSSIVTQLKAIFARSRIPATLITDNGPQFDSQHMKKFAHAYEFQHTTTSPYYLQVNGLAERMVKTVKKLLEHFSRSIQSTAQLQGNTTALVWI